MDRNKIDELFNKFISRKEGPCYEILEKICLIIDEERKNKNNLDKLLLSTSYRNFFKNCLSTNQFEIFKDENYFKGKVGVYWETVNEKTRANGIAKHQAKKMFLFALSVRQALNEEQTFENYLHELVIYLKKDGAQLDFLSNSDFELLAETCAPEVTIGYEVVTTVANDRNAIPAEKIITSHNNEIDLQQELLISKEVRRISTEVGLYPFAKRKLTPPEKKLISRGLTEIESLLERNLTLPSLLALKSRLQIFDGNREGGFKTAQFNYIENPNNIDASIAWLNALASSNELEMAEQLCEDLIAKYPNNVAIAYFKGRIEQLNKNDDAAIKAYQQVIKFDPDFIIAYMSLGKLLTNSCRYEDAEYVYKEALKKTTEKYLIHEELIFILVRQNKRIQFLINLLKCRKYFSKMFFEYLKLTLKIYFIRNPNRIDQILEGEYQKISADLILNQDERKFRYIGLSSAMTQIWTMHEGARRSQILTFIRNCKAEVARLQNRKGYDGTEWVKLQNFETKIANCHKYKNENELCEVLVDAGTYSIKSAGGDLSLIEQGINYFKEAVNLNNPKRSGIALIGLANFYFSIGKAHKVESNLKRSIEYYLRFDEFPETNDFNTYLNKRDFEIAEAYWLISDLKDGSDSLKDALKHYEILMHKESRYKVDSLINACRITATLGSRGPSIEYSDLCIKYSRSLINNYKNDIAEADLYSTIFNAARALLNRGYILNKSQPTKLSIKLFRYLNNKYALAGDLSSQIDSYHNLAAGSWQLYCLDNVQNLNHLDKTIDIYQELMKVIKKTDDNYQAIKCLRFLGVSFYERGLKQSNKSDYEQALVVFKECLTYIDINKSRQEHIEVIDGISNCYARLLNYKFDKKLAQYAIDNKRISVTLLEEQGFTEGWGWASYQLAVQFLLYSYSDDGLEYIENAKNTLEQTMKKLDQQGNPELLSWCYFHYAIILGKIAEITLNKNQLLATSLEYLERSLKLCKKEHFELETRINYQKAYTFLIISQRNIDCFSKETAIGLFETIAHGNAVLNLRADSFAKIASIYGQMGILHNGVIGIKESLVYMDKAFTKRDSEDEIDFWLTLEYENIFQITKLAVHSNDAVNAQKGVKRLISLKSDWSTNDQYKWIAGSYLDIANLYSELGNLTGDRLFFDLSREFIVEAKDLVTKNNLPRLWSELVLTNAKCELAIHEKFGLIFNVEEILNDLHELLGLITKKTDQLLYAETCAILGDIYLAASKINSSRESIYRKKALKHFTESQGIYTQDSTKLLWESVTEKIEMINA